MCTMSSFASSRNTPSLMARLAVSPPGVVEPAGFDLALLDEFGRGPRGNGFARHQT